MYVEGTSYVAVTDPAGEYHIEGVPVGNWTVRAQHPNYLEDSTSGMISAAGDSIPLSQMYLPLNANIPPVASISGLVGPFTQNEVIDFDGSGSDADGTVVYYEWDFEDDGVFDWSDSNSATTTHSYPDTGLVRVKLRVTDDKGATGLPRRRVSRWSRLPPSMCRRRGPPGRKRQFRRILWIPSTPASPKHRIRVSSTCWSPKAASPRRSISWTASTSWVVACRVAAGSRAASGYTMCSPVIGSSSTANGITSSTIVRRLQFNAPAAVSGNSIGLYSMNSGNALQMEECEFVSITAEDGTNGNTGAQGNIAGVDGSPGEAAVCQGAAGNGGSGGLAHATEAMAEQVGPRAEQWLPGLRRELWRRQLVATQDRGATTGPSVAMIPEIRVAMAKMVPQGTTALREPQPLLWAR